MGMGSGVFLPSIDEGTFRGELLLLPLSFYSRGHWRTWERLDRTDLVLNDMYGVAPMVK